MTPDELINELYKAQALSRKTSLRQGQVAFNRLYELNPEVADSIRGGASDPFYDDDRLPRFYATTYAALLEAS